VILDRADDLADVVTVAGAAVADGRPIEVRASFAGPARGAADTVAEVVVIVQQVGIGAAGAGLWAGVEMIVRSALGRRSSRREGSAGQAEQTQSLTVVIPTPNGPALVHRVSVGAQDLDQSQLSVERIVHALVKGSQEPPEVTA
jgi:hypothetical protein